MFSRATTRRIWTSAALPTTLAVYLAAILAAALLGLAPPLVVRRIIDERDPREDRGMITAIRRA